MTIYSSVKPFSRPPKSVVQGIFRITWTSSIHNFFIEFALKLGSNAIFLEQNLDVLDQWFEVEQMDSRITSWWTMRINKHVIFSDWWISRSKCQRDQSSFFLIQLPQKRSIHIRFYQKCKGLNHTVWLKSWREPYMTPCTKNDCRYSEEFLSSSRMVPYVIHWLILHFMI